MYMYMLYSVTANFELTNANNVILIQIDDIFAEISMYICMWKYLSSENKVNKRWQSFNTDSNLGYFCKIDNSGLEAGDFLEVIMPTAWKIITRVPKMTIMDIDEIRGVRIRIKKMLNDFGLSG